MTTVSQLVSKVGLDTGDVSSSLQSFQQQMVQGVGTATQQAQAKIDALSTRIEFQKRQLDILGQSLASTSSQYGASALQTQRAQLAYDRLGASIQQNERQLPMLRQRLDEIGSSKNIVEQFGDSFSSSLLGIVGPAAAASVAIDTLLGTVRKAEEGFKLAGELDESRRSLGLLINDIRNGDEAWRQATEFAQRYGFTQKEIAESAREVSGILRTTSSSVDDTLGALARLSQIDPAQGFQGAAIALRELISGDVTSLARRFEVPRDRANEMKKEIQGGADAVQVLSKYLDSVGATMDLLDQRTEGAAGKMRELAAAQERTLKAFAGESGGIGAFIVEGKIAWEEAVQTMLGDMTALQEHIRELATVEVTAETMLRAFYENLRAGMGVEAALNDARQKGLEAGTRFFQNTQQQSESVRENTGAIRANIAARADHADMTDKERESLEKQLASTFERAQDAYAKLTQAQADYARDHADRLDEHQRKLADIQREGGQRLAQIDQQFYARRTDLDAAFVDRRETIQRDLARRLADLDQQHQQDIADRQADAARKQEDIQTSLAARLADIRRDGLARIAELEQEAAQTAQERQAAAAERAQAYQERQQEIAQQLAERLADFDAQQAERALAAREAYEDKLAQLAERRAQQEQQARESAQDRERDYQERLADMAQDAADRAEDRAQQHADRLADIQRRAEGQTGEGRITRLTGETFTTELRGGGSSQADIDRLIAEENERYRVEEERARRDEAKKRERAERDRQRQEEEAAQRLAQIEAQYQQELAAAEAAYAEQEAKAAEKAARDRARIEAQAAEQLAALEEAYARQEEAAAAQAAKEDERRQQQIDKERAKLAQLEADAAASAAQQQTRLAEDLARDLAERERAYQQQRARAVEQAAEQEADNETAYVKQLAALQKAHDEQRAEAERAIQERLAQEADSYARQEAQRADAFARQQEQLKTALGEQLKEYTSIQEQLGLITEAEAARREKIIADSYLRQAEAQRQAFEQFFGAEFLSGAANTRQEDLAAIKDEGYLPPTAGGTSIGSISIVVQGASSPAETARAVREEFIRGVRASGGNVSQFFGGSS